MARAVACKTERRDMGVIVTVEMEDWSVNYSQRFKEEGGGETGYGSWFVSTKQNASISLVKNL